MLKRACLLLGVSIASVAACSSDDGEGDEGGASGGSSTADAGAGAVALGGESSAAGSGNTTEGGASAGGSDGGASQAAGGAAGEGGADGCAPAVLLLVDRSASMADTPLGDGTHWSAVQDAAAQVLAALPPGASVGLKLFPEGAGDACGPLTDLIDVPVAPGAADAIAAVLSATLATGNGTPTAAAVASASDYLQARAEAAGSRIVLITDGQPSCPLSGTGDFQMAQQDAVEKVADGLAAGVSTFVVAVGAASGSDFAGLDALALAGGEGRLSNPVVAAHFPGETLEELTTSLSSVLERATSCAVTPPIGGSELGHSALPFSADFESGGLSAWRAWIDSFTPPPTTGFAIVESDAGHAVELTGADPLLLVAGARDWTSLRLTAKLRLNADASAWLLLRYGASEQFVGLQVAEGTFKVRQRVPDLGTLDLIVPTPKPSILADTWYLIGLEISGNNVSVELDGEPLGSALIDPSLVSGGIALEVAEGTVRFDDISAVSVP